jgi:hypothetical protein
MAGPFDGYNLPLPLVIRQLQKKKPIFEENPWPCLLKVNDAIKTDPIAES